MQYAAVDGDAGYEFLFVEQRFLQLHHLHVAGDPSTCFNPNTVRDAGGNLIIGSNGKCANGGGVSGTPQAPCAFACHTASSNDSYALSKSLGVTLRINVVRDAAVQVITNLAGSRQSPNQFSVGVYAFREVHKPYWLLIAGISDQRVRSGNRPNPR